MKKFLVPPLFAFVIVFLFALIEGGCGGNGANPFNWGDDDDNGDDDYTDDDLYDDDSGYDDDEEPSDEEPEYECPQDTAPIVLFLSADDSNSQASPVVARAIINEGGIVPTAKLRTYEFTNYYKIDYELPQFGHINLVPQLRVRGESEFDREYVLQIGAQSHKVDNALCRHLNVTFSLDTSGSMEGKSIELLKETCRAIAAKLKKGDIVSMVKWRHYTSVALDSYEAQGPNDPVILDAIDELYADGSTDLHSGLVKAYELAYKNYDPSRMNRVVLISDGQANTGETDINIIAQAAEDNEREGIYLVGVGVGAPDNYFHDTLMDEVTDAGKGAYVFIDSKEEAYYQFSERFHENMEIAAKDVRIELTMPYYLIMDEFHGEEYSDNPDEVEPQHLGPNDAMVFHQFLVVCDIGLLDEDDVINVKAHYIHPFTHEQKTEEVEMSIAQMLLAPARQLLKGDAIVEYAESLKEIYRLLEDNKPTEAVDLCKKTRSKVLTAADLLQDNELYEIADLLDKYEGALQKRVK